MTSGTGIYFDGLTSVRREAVVELTPAALKISAPDGHLWGEWPYYDIEELAAPDSMLRLGRRGSPTLERLEIRDPAFAKEIDALAIHVDRTGSLQRRQRVRVIGWTFAATASLVLVAWFGLPAIAERLAPLLPPSVERKLGMRWTSRYAACSTRAKAVPLSSAARPLWKRRDARHSIN